MQSSLRRGARTRAGITLCVNRVTVQPLDELMIEDNLRRQIGTNEPDFPSLVVSIRADGVPQNMIAHLQVSGEAYRFLVFGC